ncbi:hypothetical protein [[Flexibacter] sp. ATCC 35208]|uniref:hypothetical protein n=1 Tax=[Flexibacter] sp. ATCC 35208 TaxID=1936242 RepID=UPI0011800874|nr:hypothetical protein [[Flexibacter] sp. ATCC 35208]
MLSKIIWTCCLWGSLMSANPIIKVVFVPDNRPENSQSDTLFYQSDRKLQWSDFQATPPAHPRSGAVSYSSFAYEGGSIRKKDTLYINLTLQTFHIKSASWVTPAVRDDYSLAHEQLHFDITWLVAMRFRKKVTHMALTAEDYDSMIQYEYIEFFREMNRLQKAYDNETSHGQNYIAQYRWRQAISDSLKAL